MTQTGLGLALKVLRERRTLSLREFSQLAGVDHAYVYRLETGEKTSPSPEMMTKLLKTLKLNERDAAIVDWLVEHAEANPDVIAQALEDETIPLEVVTAAASTRYRGTTRPDAATLIARVRRVFGEED